LTCEATKLTADQAAELKKAFQVMDSNGDGVVTKDELKNLLKGLGEDVTDDIVDEMIKIADENGDGKIQFEEFVTAATDGTM
jgi:calmodulin